MRIQQWFYTIPLRLRSVFRRDQVEHELDEEIRYHVEKQTEEYIAQGLRPREARAAALRALGGLEQRKEECRDHRGVSLLENVLRDTKYAFRTLRRDRGFTTGVLLLLAVGIGANVAVFSIVDGILLRPLPYRDPDRLFAVQEIRGARETGRSVNALHFLEWQRGCDCFADVALSEYVQEVNLAGDDEPERVPSIRVTPNAFSLLGIAAQVGRTFVPEDGQPGRDAVVVISDSLWHRRFGADPGVIGRTVHLDGVPSLIVGVLPPRFRDQWVFTGARANHLIDVYRPWALVPLPCRSWYRSRWA